MNALTKTLSLMALCCAASGLALAQQQPAPSTATPATPATPATAPISGSDFCPHRGKNPNR